MPGPTSPPLRARLHDQTGDRAEARRRRHDQRAERVALAERPWHLSYTALPPRTAAVIGAWFERARLADRRAMFHDGRIDILAQAGMHYVTRVIVPIKLACALLGTDPATIRALSYRTPAGRLLYGPGREYVDLARLDLALDTVSLPACSPITDTDRGSRP